MASSRSKTPQMNSEFVRSARAGDLFHYRWAARQVLNLIAPGSELESVSVEGGDEPCLSDYIIDVEECFKTKRIRYQLKYSTRHSAEECPLSFLAGTLQGFGNLYKTQQKGHRSVEYVFLTNRPVAAKVKSIFDMAHEDLSALAKINKYLQLTNSLAKKFLRQFRIIDSVEDSDQQVHHVECRLLALTSSRPMSDDARAFVEYVAERASSPANVLTKAKVLSYLGCSCEEDVFPARACYDTAFKAIPTREFEKAANQISDSGEKTIIIHAPGGVGKTAFLQWMHSCDILNGESILYDCYGGGRYRNSNKFRHRVRDAFVEIANELYAKCLCDPILKWQSLSDDAICDLFWRRISEAVKTIRSQGHGKNLYLLIDAADNAYMAAQENGSSSSFVDQLIRADIPDGCRVVFSARSERLHFADKTGEVLKVRLGGFSSEEVAKLISAKNLGNVNRELAATIKSFARGNPRVILYLLSLSRTLDDLKSLLVPDSPKTVPGIMARKIDDFLRGIRQDHDENELCKLNMLFAALAVLPPTIPISVLAKVSGVESELVESFIVDFGASFWFEDDMVHFRDEPTETYFRKTYGQSTDCKRKVLIELEKIGAENSYAALAIPKLLFEIGDYDRLFELAKTKDGISSLNKTEARHLWVLRLEFAYRAALKLKRYPDTISLAFLLASENCGNDRQRSIELDHLPFLAKIINDEEVESLCRDKNLAWGWNGSHNLAIAVLKTVRNAQSPLAQSYLHATIDWMWASFDAYEQEQKRKTRNRDCASLDVCIPTESQIALAALVIYRARGITECARFIGRWRSAISRFNIAIVLASDILSVDGNVDGLLSLSGLMSDDPAVNLAWNLTLTGYGKAVDSKAVESMITFLKSDKPFSDGFQLPGKDRYVQAILAACETAARFDSLRGNAAVIVEKRILHHTKYCAERWFENRNYVFLHAYALWLVLTNTALTNCNPASFVDQQYGYATESDKKAAISEIGQRIGFYVAKETFFVNPNETNLKTALQNYKKIVGAYGIRDWELWELDAACIELKLRAKVLGFHDEAVQDASSWMSHKIRMEQLIDISRRLMATGFSTDSARCLRKAYSDLFDSNADILVEEQASWLLDMSEVAANADPELSKQFFDKAFDMLSVVGDETLRHFDAMHSLMRRACEHRLGGDLVVRYLRCAEHAYRFDSKHFESEKAFDILAKNNMADVLAALSRLRDKGYYDFGYVLESLLKSLVRYHNFTCEEVWSMRFFLGYYSQVHLLKFVLSESQDASMRQKCFDEFVGDYSKRVEKIDDIWFDLSVLAKRFSLDDSRIRPYVRLLNRRKNLYKVGSALHVHKTKHILSKALQRIDYASETWLIDYYQRASDAHDNDAASKELIDNLPLGKFRNLLEQMSIPNGVSIWTVSFLLEKFPKEGRDSKCGEAWDIAIGKIIKRFASEGEILFLARLVDFLSDAKAKQTCLRDCLSECAETIGIGPSECFAFIELASLIVNPQEAERLATTRIESFEKEINDTLGAPPPSVSQNMDNDNPRHAMAGLLWSALGSPVALYRWNATYCISALIENGSNLPNDNIRQFQEGSDIKPYLTDGAPFYDGFAEMFFSIAVNHAAARNPKSISALIPLIVSRNRNCQNVVSKWYYTEALRKTITILGDSQKLLVENFEHELLPRTPPILMKSWCDCLPYAWPESILNESHVFAEYDVEKYWLPSLARVFGIEERAFLSLFDRVFRRVVARYDSWPNCMRHDYDKRDYLNEIWVHSHGIYPQAFSFITYASFIALTELAYELIATYPVVSYSEEFDDEWRIWLKEHLLERSDGLWLSDEQEPIPLDFIANSQSIKELDENELTHASCKKVLSLAAPMKNALPIGGNWETSAIRKRICTWFYCVLVPQGEGIKYVKKLRACNTKYGCPIPCLYSDYVKPPFLCKGKWRGILQTWKAKDWSHFERYDPHFGGFDRHQITIDSEILKLFGAQRRDLGKVLYCGRNVIARLTRWGTGENTWSQQKGPTHVGSVLWLSKQTIARIEDKLRCEVIIGARIERKELHNSSYAEPEKMYIWELARNYAFDESKH